MSFRNRCTLLGANGPVHLSIPLEEGREQKKLLRDVRIANAENWQARHWKTITSCYSRSPWFGHYREELEGMYARRFEWLVDWDLICFRWAADKMSIKAELSVSSSAKVYKEENTVDWRNRLMPATINRLYPDAPPYMQVFSDRFGFVPNLSVLDRLFCEGPVG